MEKWRRTLPTGPIGESWELADHARGMSVVDRGRHAGATLHELVEGGGRALLGESYIGGESPEFPLMVKLIDATSRLSVQVHPDEHMARHLGVGIRGKTECWVILEDGGEVYQGTQTGVGRAEFERALAMRDVPSTLNRFQSRKGEVFFLPARTVHALGAGCLLYEIQQTSDVTFRVYDWDRVGLDGQLRPLHVTESLATIDFSRSEFGPHPPGPWRRLGTQGSQERLLVECPHFVLREQRVQAALEQSTSGTCAVVTCVAGQGMLSTVAGQVELMPMQTVLVPADASAWTVTATESSLDLLVAVPRFSP
jgi:mannose-6-phosphate isomerase